MADIEQIKKNKDKMDLAPNVDFVARHISLYQEGLQRLLANPVTPLARAFADSVQFENLEAIVQPQLTPEEIRQLLSVMPESLIRLSKLTTVKYFGMVPVPTYDEQGNFSGKPEWVDYDEFPRASDHPSRILVGVSTGTEIYSTPIPRTVSTNDLAVKMYQTHVFLHEFFHTLDYPRRDSAKRAAVVLEYDGEQFTLQDFWNEFEKLYLKEDKKFVSRYAATYADKLNEETKVKEPAKFNSAIGEQICESFVGYMLGIISNDNQEIEFKRAHPEEYKLIDKVCRAKVIATD
ncbi:TPA: hypothetical protein HA246_07425 [Candidatus Woesearchaeota archaeon]|nr:hypothetical protein [Candidatus Woesearchaeota archaeon]